MEKAYYRPAVLLGDQIKKSVVIKTIRPLPEKKLVALRDAKAIGNSRDGIGAAPE
jgi:hypothetical protein